MKYRGVVLSGLPRSGKSTISKMTQSALTQEGYGWPLLYLGQKVRDQHKLEVPDGSISFEDWYKTSSVEFNRRINEEAKERMRKENLTVDSRLTALYAQDIEDYCRIFVYADLNARIFRSGLVDPGDRDTLTATLLRREEEEKDKGVLLFDGDYRNRDLYHHTLDTTNLTVEQMLDRVRGFLGKPEGKH
jgi:cytidylate kinase